MTNSVEIFPLEELDCSSNTFLQEHVEKLQEDNVALEGRLEEAYNLLEEVASIQDIEDLEEVLQQVRNFLEEKPFYPRPF